MGAGDICFKEKPDRPCRSGAMIGSAAESDPARHRLSSGFETKNRRVQRLGRAHGIEILAEEHDLAANSTQEDDIILAVDASRRLDETLCLHFGDRAFRIGGDGTYELKGLNKIGAPFAQVMGDVRAKGLARSLARHLDAPG